VQKLDSIFSGIDSSFLHLVGWCLNHNINTSSSDQQPWYKGLEYVSTISTISTAFSEVIIFPIILFQMDTHAVRWTETVGLGQHGGEWPEIREGSRWGAGRRFLCLGYWAVIKDADGMDGGGEIETPYPPTSNNERERLMATRPPAL